MPAQPEAFSGGKVIWSNFAPITFPINDVYFALALELSRVSDKIGSTLYLSPADLTWADVQSTLLRLEADITAWQQDFAQKAPSGTATVNPRSALELQLNFFSLQMILYRPFLCEIQIDEESRKSYTLNLRCTRACVRAAVTLMDHLPDAPVPHQVMLIVPWWRLLHYLVEVVAVIVLEMCLNLQHMHQSETEGLMTSLKKALYYLWAFAAESRSACRAWCLLRVMAEKAAAKCGQEDVLADVVGSESRPLPWDEQDELWVADAIGSLGR